MRSSLIFTFFFLILSVSNTFAKTDSLVVSWMENYADWGWKAVYMKNEFITIAVVPEIGGRVMQYDLGEHPFIWVNPTEFGKKHSPSEDSPWPNYGGYKTWPAPQSKWFSGDKQWPPPPNLDFGEYSCQITSKSADSVSIALQSPVEKFDKWNCKGLRMQRKLTIYKGSTKVRVEQRLTNKAKEDVKWSIWDVTQLIVNHKQQKDWRNYWVYFPIKRRSKFGKKGYYQMGGQEGLSQWKPNLAKGISAVQYLHQPGKIGADSNGGWIAYTDREEGYIYAKKFRYFEGEPYPDNGASVEVYTSGKLPYLEAEVLSPLVELSTDESYTFVVDWYAARGNGPVLEVNEAGVVEKKLTIKQEGDYIRLKGSYGIFHKGKLEVVFKDSNGQKIESAGAFVVSPLYKFELNLKTSPPPETDQVDLELYTKEGKFVGELDSLNF